MSRKKIELFLMIIVIIALCIYYFRQYQLKNVLAQNHKETIGTIIDYYEIFPSTHYLTYEYSVRNKKYKKRINPEIEFPACPDKKDCIGKRFLVYYEPNKPENSSIHLGAPR